MNVLAIHTSVNADDSATREMVSTYLARLSAAHPDLSIVEPHQGPPPGAHRGGLRPFDSRSQTRSRSG